MLFRQFFFASRWLLLSLCRLRWLLFFAAGCVFEPEHAAFFLLELLLLNLVLKGFKDRALFNAVTADAAHRPCCKVRFDGDQR